jgi:hypothetical protein
MSSSGTSKLLSLPKIISGRICDAAQPRSELRQWRQIVGLLDARAHLFVMPDGYALDCNMPHSRNESPQVRLAEDGLSLPKIISERNGDAALPKWE